MPRLTETLVARALAATRPIRSNSDGAIAILVALVMVVLLGGLGLGIEVGRWFQIRSQLQDAADAAAYSAALRRDDGASEADARAAALAAVTGAGLQTEDAELTVRFPDAAHVEVTIEQTAARLFSRFFLPSDLTVHVDSIVEVTHVPKPPICIYATAVSGAATLSLPGVLDVSLPGCLVQAASVSDEALITARNSLLSADCVVLAGRFSGPEPVTTDCRTARTQGSPDPLPDRLISLPPVANPWLIPAYPSGTVRNATLTPSYLDDPSGIPMMRFEGGVTLQQTVVLNPGLYIVDGGVLQTRGSVTLSGVGVAIVLINGARIEFGSTTEANLTAMTLGPWAGVVMFDSRDAAAQVHHDLLGLRPNGVVYLPGADIEIVGDGSNDIGCFALIASRIAFTGNADLRMDCSAGVFDLTGFMEPGEWTRINVTE